MFQQLYRREEKHEVNKEAEGNRQELQRGGVRKVLTVRKTISSARNINKTSEIIRTGQNIGTKEGNVKWD